MSIQVFEGMGLGALLAAVPSDNIRKKFTMALVYPLVTPIGIAIGIGLKSSFNANDPNTIVTQGAFGALSAGILFYNTCVAESDLVHFASIACRKCLILFLFCLPRAATRSSSTVKSRNRLRFASSPSLISSFRLDSSTWVRWRWRFSATGPDAHRPSY